jgi:hypothetical protein
LVWLFLRRPSSFSLDSALSLLLFKLLIFHTTVFYR